METTYYFGSIRIFTSIQQPTESLINSAVYNPKTITYRDYQYGFFDVEQIGDYLTGYLVKFKNINVECVNTESKRRQLSELQNMMVAESRFFIHPKTELIAYNTAGSVISKTIFENMFKKLFESIYENLFFQLELDTINEPYDLKSIIERFTRIRRVEISLIPSNPRFGKNWDRVDKRLKELNATHSKEVIETVNPEHGLNLENEEMNEKFSMADDGYGDVAVTGTLDDGKDKTIRLKKNQESIKAPNNKNDATTVLQRISTKFIELFKRFKNENE
jgi:hypothetical protein